MKPSSFFKPLFSSTLAVMALTACPGQPTTDVCDEVSYAQAHPEECGCPVTPPPPPTDAGTEPPTDAGTDVPAACDDAAYARANDVSADPIQSEVSNNLFAIADSNTRLVWKDAEKSAVRVVVWTTFGGYANDAQGNYTFTRKVFVTAAPQVQDLCKATTLTGNERANRVNQYLGLPITEAEKQNNTRRIAELWVKPSDLFRPCADAEVTDTTCDLTFPANAQAAHKTWLATYFGESHGPGYPTKYPFTALGYTYDWCSGGPSPVGASEYVVKENSVGQFIQYTTLDAYCAQ